MLLVYISKIIIKLRARDTIEITTPYLIKLFIEKSTCFSLRMFRNIIPARAPTGVNNAPRLDPMIVAYTPKIFVPPCAKIEENSAVIGMLFIIFENKKLNTPYNKTG